MKFKLTIFLVSILSIINSYSMDVSFSQALNAIMHDRIDTVVKCLNDGVGINWATSGGFTLLNYAVRDNRYYIAEMLLMRGADPNVGSTASVLPLFIAANNNDHRMVKLLLANNANPNSKYLNYLYRLLIKLLAI